MEDDMKRTHLSRAQRKRFDALLDLPLERFRTAIARLTPDELAALEARIETLIVGARFARGSHGLDRHRAPIEFGLLSRRWAALRREMALGREPAVQLYLVEPNADFAEPALPEVADKAA
jgi:hypothetical protein